MATWLGTTSNSWNTASNWSTNAVPTDTEPVVFTSITNNPCIVDTATAVCKSLDFTGGTGYTATINMANSITVGAVATANPDHFVTLSAGMNVSGTGKIITRANGITTLTSNGYLWPNDFDLNYLQQSTTSTVTLVDNWSVKSLALGPAANHTVTVQGAFNFRVNGNFTVRPVGGVSAYVATVAGQIPTFILADTGTWSTTATFTGLTTVARGFGPNITINAPGKTITINNGCYYGGQGVALSGLSEFKYVAGTVVAAANSTFYFLGLGGIVGYTVNLFGSTSPSATLTNTSGVNFNNLAFVQFAPSQPQVVTISGNVCVVGDIIISQFDPTATAKGSPTNTTGGTIYVKKGINNINSGMRNASNTVVVLHGTGTWSDGPVSLSSFNTYYGLTWQIQVNTTGTITLTSDVGVSDGGKLKYISGTFVSTNRNICAGKSATIEGFGSGGVTIWGIKHVTSGGADLLSFVDTVPIRITNLTFTGFTGTAGFTHGGTIGWICDNFTYIPGAAATNFFYKLLDGPSVEYKVLSSFIMRHFKAPTTVTSGSVTCNLRNTSNSTLTKAILTIDNGASQDVYAVDAAYIDSSRGQTVWNRKGVIPNTINWDLWDYPRTKYATFTL